MLWVSYKYLDLIDIYFKLLKISFNNLSSFEPSYITINIILDFVYLFFSEILII